MRTIKFEVGDGRAHSFVNAIIAPAPEIRVVWPDSPWRGLPLLFGSDNTVTVPLLAPMKPHLLSEVPPSLLEFKRAAFEQIRVQIGDRLLGFGYALRSEDDVRRFEEWTIEMGWTSPHETKARASGS